MKSLTPLTILARSSSSHFFSSSISLLSYSTTTSTSNSDEFSRNVRVAVWWDLENCSIPNGVNALRVAKNITSAIRANGIKGPVSITAFGDFMQFSRATQENLSITGVSLNHVPSGGKNSSDRSLLADLVFWVSQNPPPAHLFLISGDKDFANILHRLRMNNYNILLASNDPAPGVLCSASSIMWNWYELVRGENFSGKHFNDPPDGIIESWYDHNREPLEESIPDVGQPVRVQAQNCPDDPTGCKTRAVPRAIVNQIREIVVKYPGVDLSHLPVELQKNNVQLDKNYYGYKKLSSLLQSFPTVFELRCVGSQFFVHCCQKKKREPVSQPKVLEQADRSKADKQLDRPKVAVVNNSKSNILGDSEAKDSNTSTVVPAELNGKENPTTADVNENLSLPHSTPEIDPSSILQKENDEQPTEEHLAPTEQNNSISRVGGFRGVWRTLFGYNSDASNEKGKESTELCSEGENLEKKERIVSTSVSSSNSDEFPISEERTEVEEKSSPREGMVPKILKWCRSWKTSTTPDDKSEDFVEQVNHMNNETYGEEELFSKATFWEDLLSFLQTQEGSSLITHSLSREQMAQKMQKEGPPLINALCITDLSRLVELLISDKKWVEESTSKLFPFRPTLPAAGQPSIAPTETIPRKPEAELRADCQKHLSEMLKAKPTGFNMGLLKDSFLQTYGYELPHQQLGHLKLSSFLQTFPEVAFDRNYILPSRLSPKVVIPYNVKNEEDVLWNELGPISETNPKSSDSEYNCNYFSGDSDDEREKVTPKELMGILGSSSDINRVTSSFQSRGGKKLPPRRTINFVSDPSEDDNKGKLVDGILGTLDKSDGKFN
ncbi:hypothetical protein ACHQM5_016825 [Ranunculus cassubicifolius]